MLPASIQWAKDIIEKMDRQEGEFDRVLGVHPDAVPLTTGVLSQSGAHGRLKFAGMVFQVSTVINERILAPLLSRRNVPDSRLENRGTFVRAALPQALLVDKPRMASVRERAPPQLPQARPTWG